METNNPSQSNLQGESADTRDAEAIRILSDVEARLHGLREMHEKQRAKDLELGQREQELAREKSQLHESREQFESERAQVRAQSESIAHDATELQRERQALEERAAQVETRANKAAEELGTATELKQELEARGREMAQRSQEAGRLEQVIREQGERADEAERLAAERSEELLRVHEQISASSEEAETSRNQVAQMEQEKAGLGEQIASLEARVRDAQAVRGELEQAQQQLAETREQLAAVEGDSEEVEKLQADLDRAVSGLEQLKERYESKLSESESKCDHVASELQSLKEAGREREERLEYLEKSHAGLEEHWQRRKARLSAIRSSVNQRRQRVAQAIEKLKKRQSEAEGVLSQRGDVERARKELRAKRRKADQLIARHTGAKYAMYLAGAAALLMGMSWGIASHFVSATYLASATVEAENKDRELEPFELNEWQEYHQGMLTDAQFHIMAAERFSRRGISSLGAPAALFEMIQRSVHHRSSRSGELTIEYAASGKQRSELVLNTLVTAMRSYSETTRPQRTDGAATIVTQEATIGDSPLRDSRPFYAGGIFIGGLALLFGVGSPAWKRLSASKSAFDEDEEKAEVGAEDDWVEPELVAKKRPGGKAA